MVKFLLLLFGFVKADVFFFIQQNTALCILPAGENSDMLTVHNYVDLGGDCCARASFTSIGLGVYMEGVSKRCIDYPKMASASSWEGLAASLGTNCGGGFFLTSDNKMKAYSTEYCLTYDDTKQVFFTLCQNAKGVVTYEKCGTNPFSTTPATTTKATTTEATTTKATTTETTTTTTTTPKPTTTTTTTTTTKTTEATTTTTTTTPTTTTTTTETPWSTWSICNVTCGNGFQWRQHMCEKCNVTVQQRPCFVYCAGPQISPRGESCQDYCQEIGFFCNPVPREDNTLQLFADVNITCDYVTNTSTWSQPWQPGYTKDTNLCQGYMNLPPILNCTASNANVNRLCECLERDDVGFGGWGAWSSCSVTCEGGTHHRRRACKVDALCTGARMQERSCNTMPCPIDGGYTLWGQWATNCSVPCNGGVMERRRSCTNPPPQYNGRECYGPPVEEIVCNVQLCPIDGNWTEWTEFEDCNRPCGGGGRVRYRFCVNPRPQYGGEDCQGEETQSLECNNYKCQAVPIILNITIADQEWMPALRDPDSLEFRKLEQFINQSIIDLYALTPQFANSIKLVALLPTVEPGKINGTLDVDIEIHYTTMEERQLLILQDSIDTMGSLGKLTVVASNFSIETRKVPTVYPENLEASSNSYSTIQLTWDPVKYDDTFLNYLIFYQEVDTRDHLVRVAGPDKTTKELIGLQPDKMYTLRIAIDTVAGNGIMSPALLATTLKTRPLVAPELLEYKVTGSFSIYIWWSNVDLALMGAPPVGYDVLYQSVDENKTMHLRLPYARRNHTLTGLHPQESYVIDVCAVSEAGRGPCIKDLATTDAARPSRGPEVTTNERCISDNRVYIRWEPVPHEFLYGELRGYSLKHTRTQVAEADLPETKTEWLRLGPLDTDITLTLDYGSAYEIQVAAFNDNGVGDYSPPVLAKTCRCPTRLYSNYYMLKPYAYRDTSTSELVGVFPSILEQLVRGVCGNCCPGNSTTETTLVWTENGKGEKAEKRSEHEVALDVDEVTTISYPFLASNFKDDYKGGRFVPVFSHPGSLFVVRRDSAYQLVMKMITRILDAWPMLLILCGLVVICGLLFWLVEGRKTWPEAFEGTCNGCWLAYITAMTVGYGDLTSFSVPGRTLIMVWIFVALLCTTLIVSYISNFLLSAEVSIIRTSLNGQLISVMSNSHEYKMAVAKSANLLPDRNYTTLEEISDAVARSETDGLLVDAYSAGANAHLFNLDNMVHVGMIYTTISYGLVVSGPLENVVTLFRMYVEEHQNKLSAFVSDHAQTMQTVHREVKPMSPFSTDSPTLAQSLYICAILYVCFFIIGFILDRTLCKKMYDQGIWEKYERNLRDQRELLALLHDFKEHMHRDMGVLEKKHSFERILYPSKKAGRWKDSVSVKRKLRALGTKFHRTFDGRKILLNEKNLIYLNWKKDLLPEDVVVK